MPTISIVTRGMQRSYTPASGTFIVGGMAVEGRAGGRIGPAAAGSLRFVGVAQYDAVAPEDQLPGPTTVQGRPVVNLSVLPAKVAVCRQGDEVPMVFAAAANFGDLVVCAANGQVTPAGAAPDARTIVGRCTAPDGVSGAGVVGLVTIGH